LNDGHSELCELIKNPASQPSFGFLIVKFSILQLPTEDGFQAVHGCFDETSGVIVGFNLS